jgi:hypothetical protein
MRRGYIILILFFQVVAFFNVNAQKPEKSLLIGTYSASMDVSIFIKLTLYTDSTFKYCDQFELGGPIEYYGKWKIFRKTTLLLYRSENNRIRPMPTKWKIKNNVLISEKVMNRTTRNKSRIILTYREE